MGSDGVCRASNQILHRGPQFTFSLAARHGLDIHAWALDRSALSLEVPLVPSP